VVFLGVIVVRLFAGLTHMLGNWAFGELDCVCMMLRVALRLGTLPRGNLLEACSLSDATGLFVQRLL